MYEIKSIDPVSLGKTLALITGTVFVVCFILFVMFLLGIGEIDLDDLFYDEFAQVFVIGTIVTVAGSFVGGIVGAFVYNKASERFGGIKLDIAYHGGQQQERMDQDQDN